MIVEIDEKFVEQFELERVRIREEVYIRSAQLSRCEEELGPLRELKKEYEDIVESAKAKKDYLGEFVFTYVPAVNNLNKNLERQNKLIKKLLDVEITEEFTIEDKEVELDKLMNEKSNIEKQIKLFNEKLEDFQKKYAEAEKQEEEYSALLASVIEKITEHENDKKQFIEAIGGAKFKLKQLKTNYKMKSMVSRTDINRLPDADNYFEVSFKMLLNFWDKEPHVMPNEYTVFPQVDSMEIGEDLIISGRVVHKDGKFYRGVTVPYDKDSDDYLRLDYSNTDGIVKRSANNYLINLDNYFDGLKADEMQSEYLEARANLETFLRFCPQGVKALPLYVFDKNEIVALVGNSIKTALDVVVTNYKKENKTEELPESLTNYVRSLYSELDKKVRLANERWNKNKN